MPALTVQDIVQAGVVPSATAAASSQTFANDGNVVLLVTNTDASPHSITLTATTTSFAISGIGTLTVGDVVVAVTNGTTRVIGPFPPAVYNSTSGTVAITWSATTGMAVSVLRLPRS